MERGRRSLLPRVKRLTHACLKCDFTQLEENLKYQPARKGEKSDYVADSAGQEKRPQNSISNF